MGNTLGKSSRGVSQGIYTVVYQQDNFNISPSTRQDAGIYFKKFVAASASKSLKPMSFMPMFSENCALSCRTFFGDYISQDAVKRIADGFPPRHYNWKIKSDFFLKTFALTIFFCCKKIFIYQIFINFNNFKLIWKLSIVFNLIFVFL